MVKKSQQINQPMDTSRLIQNDQSLDARISALEKAVDILMKNYRHFEDTGVFNNDDQNGIE